MNKGALRVVLTILMYAGVALFVLPYLLNKDEHSLLFQVVGAIAAVVFGILRCYWTEEECWWNVNS